MSKNKMAKMLDDARLAGFNDGLHVGIQYNNDIYQTVLNDPDVMGKDVFGSARMLKVHQAAEKASDYYYPALNGKTNVEADVYRDKLDKKMQKIHGDRFQPFSKRYPELAEVRYKK